MLHPHQEPGADQEPRKHGSGFAHGWTKGLAAAVVIKLLVLAAAVSLIWFLQIEFEIGAGALISLHLALAGALIVLAVRSGMLGRRRK